MWKWNKTDKPTALLKGDEVVLDVEIEYLGIEHEFPYLEIDKEHAAFILKALNNFERALEIVASVAQWPTPVDDDCDCKFCSAIQGAKALLAELETEPTVGTTPE